jgi:hypothetical protein
MVDDNNRPTPEAIKQRIREKMHAIQALESQLIQQRRDDSDTIEAIIQLCHELMNEAHKLGLAEALSQKLLWELRRETLDASHASPSESQS